jgi:stage V sporulation protein B
MLISTTSTLIVPRRLLSSGIEYDTVLSMIGKFNGMAMNIIFFPMIIVNSISTILIPDLSEKLSKKNYWQVENRISQVIKISLSLGMTTLIICTIIPNVLGKLLYNRNDLGNYILFCSVGAPLAYVDTATYAVLNGLGKQNFMLKNSLIVSIEQLLILYLLTPIKQINVYSYGISLILTSLTSLLMDLHEIKKTYTIDFSKYEFALYILGSLLLYFLLSSLSHLIPDNLIAFQSIIVVFTGFLFTLFFLILVIKKKSFS